jgi:hypothetical protein
MWATTLSTPGKKDADMLLALAITLLIIVSLGYALRGAGGLISRRPYNNAYSDASAARQDHLG